MTSTGKRKDRQSITLETQIEIINKKKKWRSAQPLVILFEINKKFSMLLSKLEKGLEAYSNAKRSFDIVEKAVYKWFSTVVIIFQFLKTYLNKRHKSIINNVLCWSGFACKF